MTGSILDTFYILFDSDADKVKQGAQEADKAQENLEKKIKSTHNATLDLGDSFLTMARRAAAFLATFASVGFVARSIFDAAEYSDHLEKASASLGVNQQSLEAWGLAAKVAGGSVDGFIGSVDSLSVAMTQIDVTGHSRLLPFFQQLGISMTDAAGKVRPVLDVLPALADAFAKMTPQQSRSFGQKLGLDEGTIMLLQRGRREVDALIARQKELGVISVKDTEAAKKYKDALDDQAHVWRVLAADIGADILPILTRAIEKLTMWTQAVRKHAGLLYGILTPLAAILGVVTLRWAAAGLAGSVAIAGITAPLWLLVTVLGLVGAAVGLVWDDFKIWKEGGDSLFGPVYGWLVKIKDILDSIKAPSWLKFALNPAGALGGWIGGLAGDEIRDLAGIGAAKGALATADSSAAQSLVFRNAQSPLTGYGTKNTTIKIDAVNVNTQATDADGISQAIGKSLDTHLKQTVSTFDDGIKG